MPKIKTVPPIQMRLTAADFIRFDEQCRLSGKTRTEQARIAIRYWLDRQEAEPLQERENELEQRMKKMENHMASLLVRLGIDVNTLYFMLWDRSDPETRKGLWEAYRVKAAERFLKPLKGAEKEAKEKVANEISGQA
jgi:hypothetical protein